MSDSPIESFPPEAQEMIRKLREEAAAHRVAKNQVAEELKAAKEELEELRPLQEQHEQLLSAHSSLEERQNKISTLLDADYNGKAALELADRVKGASPEEWKADAEKLSKLFAPPASEHSEKDNPLIDPSAGSATPLNSDPTIAKLESIFGA